MHQPSRFFAYLFFASLVFVGIGCGGRSVVPVQDKEGQVLDPAECEISNEACDGLDNDCDNRIDEELIAIPTSCGPVLCRSNGERVCRNGAVVDTCEPQNVSPEACDGLDNDCDISVDETCPCEEGQVLDCGVSEGQCEIGQQRCERGQWGQCMGGVSPIEEICDGLDNDCNGLNDDVEGLGEFCEEGRGACLREGVFICSSNNNGSLVCDATVGSPSTDLCNGQDDDCDGQIDENISAVQIECGTGACKAEGEQRCEGGRLVDDCQSLQPNEERCDLIDNDCDGQTDEGCACVDGQTRDCGTSEGQCEVGQQRCERGQWGQCMGGVSPIEEICDGEDDDCDGEVDEDIQSIPTVCGEGACAADGMRICEGANMVDTCRPNEPSIERCDEVDNDCDSSVDEQCQCVNGDTRFCGSNVGSCFPGVQTCTDREWGECMGELRPLPEGETCDGQDNNCNGVIDDLDSRGGVCESGLGQCAARGIWACPEDGGEMYCTATANLPVREQCNQLDDDCDGEVDEGLFFDSEEFIFETNEGGYDVISSSEGFAFAWYSGEREEIVISSLSLRDNLTINELHQRSWANLSITNLKIREISDPEMLSDLFQLSVIFNGLSEGAIVDYFDDQFEELGRTTVYTSDNGFAGRPQYDVGQTQNETLFVSTLSDLEIYEISNEERRQEIEKEEPLRTIPNLGADFSNPVLETSSEELIGLTYTKEVNGQGSSVVFRNYQDGELGDEKRISRLAVSRNEDLKWIPSLERYIAVWMSYLEPVRTYQIMFAFLDNEGNLLTLPSILVEGFDNGQYVFPKVTFRQKEGQAIVGFFWRNHTGNEIDFVRELFFTEIAQNPDGEWERYGGVYNLSRAIDGFNLNGWNSHLHAAFSQELNRYAVMYRVFRENGRSDIRQTRLLTFNPDIPACAAEVCSGQNEAPIEIECGIGSCRTVGELTCEQERIVNTCEPLPPQEEVCNGEDDDCDGEVDERIDNEGLSEGIVCDGLDNDCNGLVDDLLLRGESCSSGLGECVSEGVWDCPIDGGEIYCNAVVGVPGEEGNECNGQDDDCDGFVDEVICPCIGGTSRVCGTAVGACSVGQQFCEDGRWEPCLGSTGPREEQCNGQDDNCDGQTDEGCDCIDDATSPCGTDIGACATGQRLCDDGRWSACLGGIGPLPEILDGVDNNCNGVIDDLPQ